MENEKTFGHPGDRCNQSNPLTGETCGMCGAEEREGEFHSANGCDTVKTSTPERGGELLTGLFDLMAECHPMFARKSEEKRAELKAFFAEVLS